MEGDEGEGGTSPRPCPQPRRLHAPSPMQCTSDRHTGRDGTYIPRHGGGRGSHIDLGVAKAGVRRGADLAKRSPSLRRGFADQSCGKG
jgi:hypothetical protein